LERVGVHSQRHAAAKIERDSRLRGLISGSKARIEMIEIKGVPRKPFDLRVTDPNACGMPTRVGHIRELLAKIKQNGGRVLSCNGELVEWMTRSGMFS
jgi:hypothetical protein